MSNVGNWRAPFHDYRSRAVYMVTIRKAPEIESFGCVTGDWRVKPGYTGSPYIKRTITGEKVYRALFRLSEIDSAIKPIRFVVMPDHVHIILFVSERTENTLGELIAKFKVKLNNELGVVRVFEQGFNDQLLTGKRRLDVMRNYVIDNPYRLAVIKANSEYFRRVRIIEIDGECYQLYGNPFLLQNPFKDSVAVHHHETTEFSRRQKMSWMYTACNGGVLVSPFISEPEQRIFSEADSLGSRFIYLQNEPLGPKFKPRGNMIEACASGRLLIVAPIINKGPLNRQRCLFLNSLAQNIATQSFR